MQTEDNKEEILSCLIFRYKLTASGVIYITALSCSAMSTRVIGGQVDIYARPQLLGGYSMKCLAFSRITCCGSASLKLCV